MPTDDQVLRTLFSEVRKRICSGKDRKLLEHLQLIMRLPTEMRNALLEPLIAQERGERESEVKFELIEELGHIAVPADYLHTTYMDKMRAVYRGREDVVVVDEWNGAWFTLASYQPSAHEQLLVSAVRQFGKNVSLGDQLRFLDLRDAVYPSSQGLLLVLEHLHHKLVPDVWYASLDSETRLPLVEGHRYVLTFQKKGTGGYLVEFQSLSHVTGANVVLLCFRKGK